METQGTLRTDFDDNVSSVKMDDFQETEPQSAKDEDGVPYCRQHHCRMKRISGGKKGSPTAYYKCPVPGCECKAQMIKTRTEAVVPPNPICCPRCSSEKNPVYCERNLSLSSAAKVIVECPSCQWRSNALAVPNLASHHFANRARRLRVETMDIGDR